MVVSIIWSLTFYNIPIQYDLQYLSYNNDLISLRKGENAHLHRVYLLSLNSKCLEEL